MAKLINKALKVLRSDGIKAVGGKAAAHGRRLLFERDYRGWIARYEHLDSRDIAEIRLRIERFPRRPLISILMPVYDTDEKSLRAAIESVREQIYPNWELCIADDHSKRPHVRRVLEEYSAKDARIRVVYRDMNGHISAASNSALELVSGDFTALMDHDDFLAPLALYFVAEEINTDPEVSIIYSDEDKISARGKRFAPTFKPDWSPDTMNSVNLFTHLVVYTSTLIRECGFRTEFDGSQDYDLALRAIEKVRPENIRHIPRVLYHWRAAGDSVALAPEQKPYAHERARNAITERLKAKGIECRTEKGVGETHRVRYSIPDPPPMVSIITRTKVPNDRIAERLAGGLDGLQYEFVSSGRGHFADMNSAAEASRGSLLLFLDASTSQMSDGFVAELAGIASQIACGAVSGKLLYEDRRIKFAGFVLGMAGGVGRPHHNFGEYDLGNTFRLAVTQNVSALSADCMMIRREVFESLGGFSDQFPNAYSDIDLCLRLIRNGYRNVWTPWATLVQSTSELRIDLEELERLRRDWPDFFERDPYYNPNLTLETEDLSLAEPPRIEKY